MTTSFLGLRRYLRQRQMEMPHDVSGVWLSIGSAMIVGILLLCSALPRPQTNHSVIRPFVIGSVDRDPNRWGPFNDGPEDDQQGNQSIADDEKTGQGAPKPGEQGSGNQGNSTGSGAQTESDRGAKGKGKKTQSGKKGKQRQGKGKSQKSGRKSQQPASKGRGKQQEKQQRSQDQQNSKQQTQENSTNAQESTGSKNQEDAGNQQKQQQTNSQSGQEQSGKNSNPSEENLRDSNTNKASGETESDNQAGRRDRNSLKPLKENRSADGSSRTGKKRGTRRNNKRQTSSKNAGGNRPLNPTNPMSSPLNAFGTILSGLGWIAKLLFWFILIVFAGWWLWKNWARVMAAWRQLLRDLADFWSRLLGQKQKTESASVETVEQPLSTRPFASFKNPFAAGLANKDSVDELVRYSFEAVEAWSRERGFARPENQTPLEFVRQVADLEPGMRTTVVRLGDLYSCAAYANRTLGSSDLPYLKELWTQLETAPPPVPLTL